MVGSLQSSDMTKVLPFTTYFLEPLFFLMITSVPVFGFGRFIPLKINMLHVPSPAAVGDSVLLRCDYDLGDETLYAFKFYKNMEEFYRYDTRSKPSKLVFHQPGVNVDLSKSGNDSVYLRNLTLDSSGNYTCQVSTDAPFFNTKEITKQLKVVGFGHNIPLKINMLHVPSPAAVGDSVLLRCDYDLGDETLYAFMFYKNMIEFYRYVPEDNPPLVIFNDPGVNVDLSKSGNNSVYLRNLTLDSSGNYTCQVYTDQPHFNSEEITKELKVVDIKRHIPLKVNMLHIPSPAVVGDSVLLRCDYDLGDETLATVEFYLNLEEFYRYDPNINPPKLVFPLPGVNVDLSKSGNSSVYLRNLTLESSGNYTCEVTTDAPDFSYEEITKELEVVGSGHYIPLKINMLHVPSAAEVGDSVLLKCDYDLGDETLSTFKMYKNMIEFYRYAPEDYPPIMIFREPGVNVDLSKTGVNSVYLRNLTLDSSGNYTCQVSTEQPHFNIEEITKPLKVVGHYISLKINSLHIPSPAVVGDSVLMRCDYDLGDETLYDVKFYKNMEEFYRYDMWSKPPKLVFPQPGVNVDLSKSGNSSVYLQNLTLESSGNYTCEVSTNAPRFNFEEITKQLEVVVPPSEGPVLREEKSDYKVGDNVSIHCHSGKSKPAPDLKWYINDQPVISHLHNRETVVHPDQLESSSLALNFRLKSDELQNGKVTVKCVATVKHISAETSIEITASVSSSQHSTE